TDRAAQTDTDLRGVRCGQSGVGHRLRTGGERELAEPVDPPSLVRGQSRLHRIEVALRRHLGPEPGRVEEGDPPGRRYPAENPFPERLPGHPTRRDHPDAGDDHPARADRQLGLPASSSATSVSTWPRSGRGANGLRKNTTTAGPPPT